MKQKKNTFKRLEPLRWTPIKIYALDQKKNLVLIRDEKADKEKNDVIKNTSGGISIDVIHNSIEPLFKKHYKLHDDDIGGDAPKDFIGVYEPGNSQQRKSHKWNKHISKVGHKWYPLESISEHLLNRIGDILGLKVAASQLRLIHGQIRFLSRYFLEEGENMIHGAQIYSAYLQEKDNHFVQEIEDKQWARTLLTFQVTDEAVNFLFPREYETLMNDLVSLLVFDAITGNNDRHFYNWAIITHVEGKQAPKFSPIYDSARGLFWNRSEDVIEQKFFEGKDKKITINKTALETYLQSSRPKIGWEGWKGQKEINHFQLISKIHEHYPQYQEVCKTLIKSVHLDSIYAMLDSEFTIFYTTKRLHLIKECLKRRFEILNHLCNSNCYD